MIIYVEAHPRSKKEELIVKDENHFKVYIKEPPIEGKANKAIVEVLSRNLKVPKSSILLKKGKKGKIKVFEII